MSFSSWPLTFAHDVAETVGRIRGGLYPPYLPPALYHYTSFEGVSGIVGTRTLWATCVEDLEDQSEIRHGIEMVQAEIQQRQYSGVASFPQLVLRLLPEALSTRRIWTFVACFRAKRVQQERGPYSRIAATVRSAFGKRVHQERAPYCLQFDTLSSWEPRLRPVGLHADVQYHRVIYEPAKKRKAIRCAVNSIVDSAVRNSRGDLQGPWAQSIARDHARIAAQGAGQGLMDIISSFKCFEFRWEDEWRIVCRPRCSAAGSAPDLDDDGFRHLIKKDKRDKRYVELRVDEQGEMLVAFPRSAIPFSLIYVRRPLV